MTKLKYLLAFDWIEKILTNQIYFDFTKMTTTEREDKKKMNN